MSVYHTKTNPETDRQEWTWVRKGGEPALWQIKHVYLTLAFIKHWCVLNVFAADKFNLYSQKVKSVVFFYQHHGRTIAKHWATLSIILIKQRLDAQKMFKGIKLADNPATKWMFNLPWKEYSKSAVKFCSCVTRVFTARTVRNEQPIRFKKTLNTWMIMLGKKSQIPPG